MCVYVCSSGVEEKIEQLIRSKERKSSEVSDLLETVESLQQEISKKAEVYALCTS